MLMKDEEIAAAVSKWWRKYYKEVPASQTEKMVKEWLLRTLWAPEMPVIERVKLQNRVSSIIRSSNGRRGAGTRKTRAKAEKAARDKAERDAEQPKFL